MAREIVYGDAIKKYSMMCSYGTELMNANRGNTCRLKLEHPAKYLVQRFGRFYVVGRLQKCI